MTSPEDDFSFTTLTPDLILDAIEETGLTVSSGLTALNSYENRVYQFVVDQGARYVVKFYRPARWSNEAILEEHQFAQELSSSDIPVVAPIAFDSSTLLTFQGYRYALFPSVGGRQFELDNLNHIEWMGRFIGRMHRVAQSDSFQYRQSLQPEETLQDAKEKLTSCELIPDILTQPLVAILLPLIEKILMCFEGVSYDALRLHGDCHPGNILWRDGPTFVDLDDAISGPAIQDLWMMLSGQQNTQSLQLSILIDAYEEFQDFNPNELQLIEPLRALRLVKHMAWIVERWEDPAFPRAFPWFAEQKYWENQILALKEQFSSLDEPALSIL